MNNIEPLKITVEYYDMKISVEIDRSDLTIDELHGMWLQVVRAMGYHMDYYEEYYKEEDSD